MIKKLILLIVLLLSMLVFSGCILTADHADHKEGVSEQVVDPIQEQIKEMSLTEKVGQMMFFGFDGYTVDELSRNLIEKYQVGGIILFKRNVLDTNQLRSLNNSFKKINSENKIPLFISVDEEGGTITRMPDEFKQLPTNKVVGKINNSEFSFKIGNLIAAELKLFGFNMNFAPVLDININPKNKVIGDRSFGPDVDIVSNLGVQTMKGIQAGGVIPVVKHFPGHGNTSLDSHIGLPKVDADWQRLKHFELVPFMKAIENDVDAIMIAHILLPQIDPQYPASLSKKIITDILKKELSFDGVIITDDLTMGAITENYGLGEAAVRSIIAGADILLVCHGYENQIAVIKAVQEALANKTISEERIDASVYKILKLKQKYHINNQTEHHSIDVKQMNQKINNLLNSYIP